jgi:hypothetical protein
MLANVDTENLTQEDALSLLAKMKEMLAGE